MKHDKRLLDVDWDSKCGHIFPLPVQIIPLSIHDTLYVVSRDPIKHVHFPHHSSLGLCRMRSLHCHVCMYILLKVNRTKDEDVQPRTHSRRHMNNVLNEIVNLTPCLPFIGSFPTWFLITIWDNVSPNTPQPCRYITIIFFFGITFL